MEAKKSIFITGAASGIGRATALCFAQRGWLVGLFDVNEGALASLAVQIGPSTCCWRKLDVTSATDFECAVRQFSEQTGGTMDVLFNCAGVMFVGKFGELGLDKLGQTIRTNVEGTIIGTHVSLPLLRNTPGARVVNMSSASAFYGVPEMAVYSASKAAIRALTEALDLELEQVGITVCDIMPSFVESPMLTGQAREVGSLKSLGVRMEPAQVASEVWRAAHGRKVHWIPEWRIWLTNALTRCSTTVQRAAMKRISG